LREFRVDINFKNKEDRNTALHLAAFWAQEGMVKLLLESGADPLLTNKYPLRVPGAGAGASAELGAEGVRGAGAAPPEQGQQPRYETALDAARAQQQTWNRNPWATPTKQNRMVIIFQQCFSRTNPPRWEGILEMLERAMAERQTERGRSDDVRGAGSVDIEGGAGGGAEGGDEGVVQDGPVHADQGRCLAEGPRPREDKDTHESPLRAGERDLRPPETDSFAESGTSAWSGPSQAPLQDGKALIADEDFEEFSFRPQKRQN